MNRNLDARLTSSDKKRAGAIIAALVAAIMILCVGCSNNSMPKASDNPEAAASTVEKLNNARVIRLEKKVTSLNANYTVKADGVEVAKITGNLMTIPGNLLTMTDKEGNLIGSAAQQRSVFSDWILRDASNEQYGLIEGHASLPLAEWNIKMGDRLVAKATQKVAMSTMVKVTDARDDKQYTIRRDHVSVLGAKANVTRETDTPSIDGVNAAIMGVIALEADTNKDAK